MVCLSCGYLSKGIHFLCSYFRIGGASIIAHTAHQINHISPRKFGTRKFRHYAKGLLYYQSKIKAGPPRVNSPARPIMPLAEAMAATRRGDADLDLVKISPNAVPPVCKLMDYGKYNFEQTKRDKEAKKNQRIVEIKEVRMSPGIDVNDFNVKVRNAQRFLADGNRVKVAVRFRGREMAHTDIGKRLLEKFAADCAEVATMDKEPKLDGRHMTMFLSCRQNKETKK